MEFIITTRLGLRTIIIIMPAHSATKQFYRKTVSHCSLLSRALLFQRRSQCGCLVHYTYTFIYADKENQIRLPWAQKWQKQQHVDNQLAACAVDMNRKVHRAVCSGYRLVGYFKNFPLRTGNKSCLLIYCTSFIKLN